MSGLNGFSSKTLLPFSCSFGPVAHGYFHAVRISAFHWPGRARLDAQCVGAPPVGALVRLVTPQEGDHKVAPSGRWQNDALDTALVADCASTLDPSKIAPDPRLAKLVQNLTFAIRRHGSQGLRMTHSAPLSTANRCSPIKVIRPNYPKALRSAGQGVIAYSN
jgi:hypothetical protein